MAETTRLDREGVCQLFAAIQAYGDACLSTDVVAGLVGRGAAPEGTSAWDALLDEHDAGRRLLPHAIAAYRHLWAEFEGVADAT